MQIDREAKAFNGKVCSIDRKGIGIMVFRTRQRGKQPFLFIENAIGNIFLLDIRLLFVREWQSKKFVHKMSLSILRVPSSDLSSTTMTSKFG